MGFVRVLDQVNNAALTLRALTVIVNLHTLIGDAVSSASDALNDLGDGDVPYTRDNSHATRHFIRPEYLRPLRLKLASILHCDNPDIRALSLRLVSLLPAIPATPGLLH